VIKDPPQATFTFQAEINEYTLRQRSVVIRPTRNHCIVALIEIISPGNKASEYAFAQLLAKVGGALSGGIHLLVIDLLPPTPRDPHGIHAAIWESIRAGTFIPPGERHTHGFTAPSSSAAGSPPAGCPPASSTRHTPGWAG
jgi:hypothetical protein